MVGHLKCIVNVKFFGGQKGGSSKPPQPPLPMGLQCGNSTVRQLGVDHLSSRLIQLTDCSFIPRICGVGTRLVIVTIQLLFVEATIVSTCSAVVVNKLGGAVMLNANALQSQRLNVNRLRTRLSSMQLASSMISNYIACCYGNSSVEQCLDHQ